jgi:cytochrome b561
MEVLHAHPNLTLVRTLLQQSQPRTQKVLSTWHWQINVLALLCFIATFVIMFVSRQQKGKQHFDSTHAQVGLATIIYLLFVALFGSLVRFFPSAFGGPLKARYWNAWHRWGGYGMLILLYATLYLALTKKSTVKRMDSTVWWISLFALIFSALILFGRANWNRMIQSVVPKRQS